MIADAIVQRMLEDDEVESFLDRNDDLGWHYIIRADGIHSWAWDKHMQIEKSGVLGPYPTLESAVEAAKQHDLHSVYMSVRVSMVPKHVPDLNNREEKLKYIRQCSGWDLDRAYNIKRR